MGWGQDEDWYDDDEFVTLPDGVSVYSNLANDARRLLCGTSPGETKVKQVDPTKQPFSTKQLRFKVAQDAPVGSRIRCPWCNCRQTKRSYQHKFCSTKHKDMYWNTSPARIGRTNEYS